MTAKTLREYHAANCVCQLDPPSPEWRSIFTPTTVQALLNEIDRLRVKVGERPSYESDGSLREALAEMCEDEQVDIFEYWPGGVPGIHF